MTPVTAMMAFLPMVVSQKRSWASGRLAVALIADTTLSIGEISAGKNNQRCE
jgi:hypothetical protein